MDVPGYSYATLVAVGGAIGYFKAGSTVSLGVGTMFGVLLGYGASRVSQNPKDVYLSLGLSVVLLVVMGSRFIKSGKFMPAGLISAVSLVMFGRYLLRLF
ncbi:Transmembrane protein 14C [Entomophthora muscae]|uniref:Transmembrane protein 14C n=3 Tax=Entomophthora muscae TaxID=34485 RepID=A0ACC2SI38_9FUNG|nr:Transmembrane protein 14C [Entomophthora muscae]KAJ9083302.1 Transmembrane protein 14C [Entomophthora muscae]